MYWRSEIGFFHVIRTRQHGSITMAERLSGCVDEARILSRSFRPKRRFNSGSHVDAVGAHRTNGLAYIFWRQSARQDDRHIGGSESARANLHGVVRLAGSAVKPRE